MKINTLINCSDNCCGCLDGTINKDGTIAFVCNECGREAGYINVEYLKASLQDSDELAATLLDILSSLLSKQDPTAGKVGQKVLKTALAEYNKVLHEMEV